MPAAEAGGSQHGNAYRCSLCGNNYPRTEDYAICPVCGEPCTGYTNVSAMPEAEAASIAAHARFERYYEDEHEPDLELTEEEERLVLLSGIDAEAERLAAMAKVIGRS